MTETCNQYKEVADIYSETFILFTILRRHVSVVKQYIKLCYLSYELVFTFVRKTVSRRSSSVWAAFLSDAQKKEIINFVFICCKVYLTEDNNAFEERRGGGGWKGMKLYIKTKRTVRSDSFFAESIKNKQYLAG
jgi:hypothetical protein